MAQPQGHGWPGSEGPGAESSSGTSGMCCAGVSGAGCGCERLGGVQEQCLLKEALDTVDGKGSNS